MVTEVKIVLTFMGTVGIDWKGHEGTLKYDGNIVLWFGWSYAEYIIKFKHTIW